jgi:hypothetical protein
MSDELDTRRIEADKRHHWTKLEDEIILLHQEKSAYYTLNGVGARAWELLQQPQTVDEIVQTLTQEYDVSSEVCRADLIGCLQDLIRLGFIRFQDDVAD